MMDGDPVDDEPKFISDLRGVKNNDPSVTELEAEVNGDHGIQNISNAQWEEIGRDITNNTHLKKIQLNSSHAINDEKASYLFRGLTRSTSVKELDLDDNYELSVAGVRSMVPFLQHADNLKTLRLGDSNMQSEGFNFLLRVLHDSPVEHLDCWSCDIESIEIELEQFPRKLKLMELSDNNINADGCGGLAKLLQGRDSTLTYLELHRNKIGDEGVAILVDALKHNISLRGLYLTGNNGISKQGLTMLLKLVNDVSSIKATLQSNHTLSDIDLFDHFDELSVEDEEFQREINMATEINKNHSGNPEAAGRDKVIQTQLHNAARAKLAKLQGVSHSVYSEINPLHLPEVLSLVGKHHGQGELCIALKSSIVEVISTVNRKQCLKQEMAELHAYYAAKSAEVRAEIAKIEATERSAMDIESGEYCSNKRRRK